jgi:hypothetical protein
MAFRGIFEWKRDDGWLALAMLVALALFPSGITAMRAATPQRRRSRGRGVSRANGASSRARTLGE